MNTVWLRSLMRRYGIPGLLFVAVYLAAYTLWKRGADPLRTAFRRGIAVIGVIVFGLSGLFTLFDKSHPGPESDFIAVIRQERFQDAMKMLEDGADPNDVYTDLSNAPCLIGHTTALELAVMADQKALVEALFQHGVHPPARAVVATLSFTSLLEKDDMFRTLLAHSLPIDTKWGDPSRTALMEILGEENVLRGARRLLNAGADVNQSDAEGRTALMCAAEKGNLLLVQLLLAKGADPRRKDKQGASALSLTTGGANSPIVALLKQSGAYE